MNTYDVAQFFFLSAIYVICCTWGGFAVLNALLRKFGSKNDEFNGYLWLFFSMTIGMGLHLAQLFFLALAGHLDALSIASSSGLMLLLASLCIFRHSDLSKVIKYFQDDTLNTVLNLLVVVALFAFVACYALQAPGEWDDTSYHLPYAQFYLDHKSLQVNEYLRFPLFPNHMDILFSFGLLYGGVVMAQAMATLPLFVIALGLIGATRQFLGSSMAGLIAFCVFFNFHPLIYGLGHAYIDNGLALYCWAALLALMQMRKDDAPQIWLIIAAFMAGTAADIKLFGVVWAMLLCGYVALSTKRLGSTIFFGVGCAAFGTWWYIRSYWISGDPIHPFGGPLFGYYLWNAQDLAAQHHEQASYGAVKGITHFWTALVQARVTMLLPVFFLPLLYRWIDRRIFYAYLVFVGYFLFWFYSSQVERYLMACLALASFLMVYLGYRLFGSAIMRFVRRHRPDLRPPYISAVAVLVLISIFLRVTVIETSQRIDEWTQTLKSRPGYELYQHANGLDGALGHRVLQLGFENGIYFYHGVVIGDVFGIGRSSQFASCKLNRPLENAKVECTMFAPELMVQKMATFNSQILLINTEVFTFDLPSYLQYFDVLYRTKEGYLMTPKRGR